MNLSTIIIKNETVSNTNSTSDSQTKADKMDEVFVWLWLSMFILVLFGICCICCIDLFEKIKKRIYHNCKKIWAGTSRCLSSIMSCSVFFQKPSMIMSVETKQYDSNQDNCAICLEKINRSSRLAGASSCNHVFHKACIIKWGKNNDSCPLCRINTVVPEVIKPKRREYVDSSSDEEEEYYRSYYPARQMHRITSTGPYYESDPSLSEDEN